MRRSCIVLFLLISAIGVAQKRPVSTAVALEPNGSVEATLSLLGPAPHQVEFTLDVGEEVFYLELEIEESETDLDLEISLDYLSGFRAETLLYNERMVLTRTTDPYLETGTATVRVLYQYDSLPIIDGEPRTDVPFRLRVTTRAIDEAVRRLSMGDSVSGTLHPETGMVDVYRVRVPRGARALRLDIGGADGDLDLFAFPGSLVADPFLASHVSQTIRSTETLVISDHTVPELVPGLYYVMVLDQVSTDAPVTYQLFATASADAPEELLETPALDPPSDPLERALLSTVEVLTPDGGGSGCLISADGLIITNWHVVEGLDGLPETDITVGFSTDHTRPPAEAFRAEVVDYAADRDLALLRIVSGRYGQPLPARMSFPFHEIADSPMTIATPLQFIGYPWIGGTGSRASVTYTRGTVAGFQRTTFGMLVKTDGEINPGNSGGAALDAEFRLVGFPSSTVGENAGQLAYVVPVSAIPRHWLEEAGR